LQVASQSKLQVASQSNHSEGLSQQAQEQLQAHGAVQSALPQQLTTSDFATKALTAQASFKEAASEAHGPTESLPCAAAAAAVADKQAAVDAFKRAFSGRLSNSRKPASQKFDYLLV
jgi:hypothetical protein